MTSLILMGITAAVTWALTNAYWADRNQTEITDLWTAFYKEMQQVRTKERTRIESLRASEGRASDSTRSALDMLDEFANEYHISDGTVFALKGDFERAFRKLSEIHHNKGENNGDYAHPTVE